MECRVMKLVCPVLLVLFAALDVARGAHLRYRGAANVTSSGDHGLANASATQRESGTSSEPEAGTATNLTISSDELAHFNLDRLTWQPHRSKPLIWFHIHKAAGTFMCEMATWAGERVVQPNRNCNWVNHDGYRDSGHLERAVSCQQRLALWRASRFTFGSIERELWPSDWCPDQFAYGILLREPIDLIHSDINFRAAVSNGQPKDALLADLRRRLATGDGSLTSILGPAQTAWKFLDNIQTRLLAGAINVPPGRITHLHVAKAAERLARFTAVGRVEDLRNAPRRRALFARMGWNPSLMVTSNNNANDRDVFHFTPAEAQWLREVNKHDIELYAMVSAKLNA